MNIANELPPAPSRRDSGLPAIPVLDEAPALFAPEARSLAEKIIIVGRVSRISPEAQRALFVGQMGSGKANTLDAVGIAYEESDNGRGSTAISIRPAGAESPKE